MAGRQRFIEFHGRTARLTEWAREFDLAPNTLRMRLDRGMSVAAALTTEPLVSHAARGRRGFRRLCGKQSG